MRIPGKLVYSHFTPIVCSRDLQGSLDIFCERMRAAEHAPRDPLRVLERRYGLAEIVERSAGVAVERLRVIPPHFERQSMSFSESASRHGYQFAQHRPGFFEALETHKGVRVVVGHPERRGPWLSVRIFTPSTRRAQVVTFAKWIPKPLPEPTTRAANQKLLRELSRSSSLGSALSLSGRSGRDRFRAAARAVIAAKRLSTVDSDPSRSRKED
jgi:hypothetical protein